MEDQGVLIVSYRENQSAAAIAAEREIRPVGGAHSGVWSMACFLLIPAFIY
jgi:hypothetical protein